MQSSEAALDASIPLVRQLRGAVSEDELRGLARDLRPTVPALARLSRESVKLAGQARLLASCSNEVVYPWSQDKVEDQKFPAEGPVYQEAPKGFVGLAGESRSGDANGQWFRVLASSGTNLVTFAPGVFGTTATPILGANPPKPKNGRPPLEPDTPCETQEPPDLRSQPGAPPEQKQIDTSAPAYRERLALARGRAIKWLKKQIKAEKLTGELNVSDKDATKQLIERIASGKKSP